MAEISDILRIYVDELLMMLFYFSIHFPQIGFGGWTTIVFLSAILHVCLVNQTFEQMNPYLASSSIRISGVHPVIAARAGMMFRSLLREYFMNYTLHPPLFPTVTARVEGG